MTFKLFITHACRSIFMLFLFLFSAERDPSSYSKVPRNPGIFASTKNSVPSASKPKRLLADSFFKSILDYTDDGIYFMPF